MFGPILSYITGNKYVIAAILCITLFTGAYIYYLRTSAKIEGLEHDNQLLTLENASLHTAIDKLQHDYAEILQAKDSLVQKTSELEKQTTEIKQTLYRENQKKKSLEELALKKTSLIEKKVNEATDKVLKCFDTITDGGDC